MPDGKEREDDARGIDGEDDRDRQRTEAVAGGIEAVQRGRHRAEARDSRIRRRDRPESTPWINPAGPGGEIPWPVQGGQAAFLVLRLRIGVLMEQKIVRAFTSRLTPRLRRFIRDWSCNQLQKSRRRRM